MIEQIVIGIIFILALGYLFQVVRKNFSTKQTSGCAKGCGTCSASEVKTVEAKKTERKLVQV
ncbi:FeoB-associated Cys-rich membrane protein [Rhodocytophaga rosea]|uniref:FeoB-associated Cys-rich membrane protein n=1 Tax=Rhodocytophaga rosea TaxID=2704465 RepID=A0A6C0GSM8_9BACT|nr:FeoB-associated Cys-rich membrane protein [Rhodocytophaga rosea]QHT71141.1 FeoB-associated Cys-rich membrane protein [Rhodocytophaga rosea]